MLDDENSMILWEPGSRTTPVYYSGRCPNHCYSVSK